MSTRFYPRFVRGNPQLRIFLPDWKMILIKPKHKMPEGVISLKVDPRMTDWDVKNYLEKIYNIQVGAVNSRIHAGRLIKKSSGIVKADDYKIAHVALAIGQKFEWPDLFPEEKFQKMKSEYEDTLKMMNENKQKTDGNKPGWFL